MPDEPPKNRGGRPAPDPEWVRTEAAAVVAEQSDALIKWLDTENLTPENIAPESEWPAALRLATKGPTNKTTPNTHARLKWATECAESMRSRGVHENRKVCRLVALYYSRAYVHRTAMARKNRVKKLDHGYTNEEWVLSHPGLVLSRDDPLVKQDCIKYELLNKCPNPEARNLLEHCARDPQYCNDLYKATRARKSKIEDASVVKSAEVKEIENLEAELLALVGEDDDVWP